MNQIYESLNLRRFGFIVIFTVLFISIVLSDPDYFWHLSAGQYIWENKALPSTDVFSYTFAGKPWVLHEWLFEIILFGIYSLSGGLGVKLFTATFATATVLVAYAIAKRLLGKPYWAFFLALILFFQMVPNISPRPQLITFLLFAVFLRVLVDFKYFSEVNKLWLLPVLMVLWVNSHGGYVAGLVLVLLFVACEWLMLVLLQQGDALQKQRLKKLTMIAMVTVAVTLLNPYFIDHWIYPFTVMNMDASQNLITEWRSPDFHTFHWKFFLLLVFGALTAAIYSDKRPDFTEIILSVFFISSAFISIRHAPISVLGIVFLTSVTLGHVPFAKMFSFVKLEQLAMHYRRSVGKGKDLGKNEFLFNWILLAITLIGCLLYYPVFHAKDEDKINKTVPVKAVQFIKEAGIEGRAFSVYHYGGYLINQFYPEQLVFIDGRADLYGDKFIQEYLEIVEARAGWKEKLEKHRIDYVIVTRKSALVELLQMSADFKLIYEDEVNAVLLKNDARYAAIISKYARTNADKLQ
ncbi:MAG TPA: hypothetical protein VIO87_03765 [Methylotenera sp.]